MELFKRKEIWNTNHPSHKKNINIAHQLFLEIAQKVRKDGT
jgi:hypothetical protein